MSLHLAEREGRNNIAVLTHTTDVRYNVISECFRHQASKARKVLSDVRIINLRLINVDPLAAPQLHTGGDFKFDYRCKRDELLLFILANMEPFITSPVAVVRQNQYCRRRCGNVNMDSRCFGPTCQAELELAHPPLDGVSAASVGLPHSGDLNPPAHWDMSEKKKELSLRE